MQETFSVSIANIYDQVMDYFDYKKSAQIINGVIESMGGKVGVPRILEIGVGTGACALELIALGYEVEGIDHSPGMLAEARRKWSEKSLPLGSLHQCDVKDFSLDSIFDVVLSHAGPLRIDYTQDRGYFFETYLASDADLEQAVGRISDHLTPAGLLLMSIQTTPDPEKSTRSTPHYRGLGDGYIATKTIIEAGNKRTKIRELKKGGLVIARVEHQFLVIDLERFNALAACRKLCNRGPDATNHFQIFKKTLS